MTLDDLRKDLLTDQMVNARKNREKAEARIKKPRDPFFGRLEVPEITTAMVKQYFGKQMGEGEANGTINRELSLLKRVLNPGAKHTPPKCALRWGRRRTRRPGPCTSTPC